MTVSIPRCSLRRRQRSPKSGLFLVGDPFSLAVNLQTCAVEKKIQWLRMVRPLEQDCQATIATAEGRVIGDGDIDPEHIGDRTQKTLGLTQQLVEHCP